MPATSRIEAFLTPQEEQEIVAVIIQAESHTSGEIRVHIESNTTLDHFRRAQEVFHMLKMDNTKEGNGVLIYVAVEDKKFVIYGDTGINAVVPKGFWDATKDIMQQHFKRGAFKKGIIEGITSAGNELKAHFPRKSGDHNELSNEVSQT